MALREIRPESLAENPFSLIGRDWMLVTAGTMEGFNTMTASWGGMGVLWDRSVCFIFIRPTRYTYEFIERSDSFSLSFFEEKYRKALQFCGSHSGRDTDKIKGTGLTPFAESGVIAFKEARLVIACRKIYFQDILPANFLDSSIDKMYAKKDYHRMYVGEITKCLVR